MAAWVKVTRPNVELSNGFQLMQAVLIDLDTATSFGIQNQGTVAVFIDGKTYVVQSQNDKAAYDKVLAYIKAKTGATLP